MAPGAELSELTYPAGSRDRPRGGVAQESASAGPAYSHNADQGFAAEVAGAFFTYVLIQLFISQNM